MVIVQRNLKEEQSGEQFGPPTHPLGKCVDIPMTESAYVWETEVCKENGGLVGHIVLLSRYWQVIDDAKKVKLSVMFGFNLNGHTYV